MDYATTARNVKTGIDDCMDYQGFEAEQAALQGPMVDDYGREFQQFSNQELVRVFHELLELEDVSCILELGAHRAATSKRFVKAKAGRKAVAIEANPFNVAKFGPLAEEAGVLYLNYALNDRTGPLDLVLSDSDQDRKRGHTKTSNSILRNLDFGRTKNVEVPGITFDDLEHDPAFKDYLPSLADARPALWIDVEGALSQLLAGAHTALPKCLFAMAEVERVERFEGQKTVSHVARQFADLGFFPFLRDSEYMPTQHNVIFVNGALVTPDKIQSVKETFVKNIKDYKPETT
ncbi:methyltransferase, FkbM family [Roseobacter sp. GAI101]|nr:methyltransferase, FkbM family [Roseobacter sp. GAI101]